MDGRRARPGIILMDVQMPVMDGYQAARTIRTQISFEDFPEVRNVPIIGMSEFETRGDQDKCHEAGMDEFMPKPVDRELLEKTLTKWILAGKQNLETPTRYQHVKDSSVGQSRFPDHGLPPQSSLIPPTPPYIPPFQLTNNPLSNETSIETPLSGHTEYPFPLLNSEFNILEGINLVSSRTGTTAKSPSEADQVRATASASLTGQLRPSSARRRLTKEARGSPEIIAKEGLGVSADKAPKWEVHSWFSAGYAHFKLKWDLVEFVKTELPSPQALESVLTVSRTPERAFAATCSDYVKQFWPRDGNKVIKTLTAALEGASEDKQLYYSRIHDTERDLSVCFSLNDGYTGCTVTGPREELMQVASQLLWLSAVFRIPEEGQLLSSKAGIEPLPTGVHFEIASGPISPVIGSSGNCWSEMFEGFVLAEDFPIPERGEELGVEMPFEEMTLLGLIWYPCNCDDKLFLKGDTTALIPTSTARGDSIQWHFFQSEDKESQIPWEVIRKHAVSMVDVPDVKELAKKWAFVGYFPDANIHLGTRGSGFGRIQFSGAGFNDKRKLKWGHEYSGNIGTSGMGIFGAGLSAKMVVHHTANQRIRLAQKRILQRVSNSKHEPALLYDVGSGRAWLVPQLSVVLHLVLAWASFQDDAEELLDMFPYAEAHYDGGAAAHRAIKPAMDMELPESAQTPEMKTFSQLLSEFFAYITNITDQQMGSGVKEKKGLVGYEFKKIAEEREHIFSKRASIDGARSAGWLKLIASTPDVPVLFCSNLADPVKPAPGHDTENCLAWREVPRDQYFLAASIQCIKYLSEQCGGTGILKLYKNLYCVPSEAKKKDGRSFCRMNHSPCYHFLFEVSNHIPKEAPLYPERGAVIIGKLHSEWKNEKHKTVSTVQEAHLHRENEIEGKGKATQHTVRPSPERNKELPMMTSRHRLPDTPVPSLQGLNTIQMIASQSGMFAEPYSVLSYRPAHGAACTPPPDPFEGEDMFDIHSHPRPAGKQGSQGPGDSNPGFGVLWPEMR